MGIRALSGVICALALAGCGGGGYGGGNDPPANRAPLTQADAVRTRPGTAVEIAVLANDSDPDGDALTVVQPVAPASGTVELLGDNRLRVTPAAGFSGDLTFSYQARDARGALSPNTSVRVTVGPIARAMLGVGTNSLRVVVSGTRPGESAVLFDGGPCGPGMFATISSDMRTLIGTQCGTTSTRRNLVVMSPRAATLGAPQVLLANVALGPGLAPTPDGAAVTVTDRVVSPDDLSVPGSYEFVRVNVTTRTVIDRQTLPGVSRVDSIQGVNGSSSKLLVVGGVLGEFPPFDMAVFYADLDAHTFVQVSEVGDVPASPGLPIFVPVSANGRYIVNAEANGDLTGYDVTDPGNRLVFWSAASHGKDALQPMPAPVPDGATMMFQSRDWVTGERAIWELPLGNPGAAREVLRFDAAFVLPPLAPMIIGADRFLLVSAAATPTRAEVREIRFSTGEVLSTLTPPGGIYNIGSIQRLGSTGILFGYDELISPPADFRDRAGIIRYATPGVVEMVAPDLDLTDALLAVPDRDGTTLGITIRLGGSFVPYLVDVNDLRHPLQVTEGLGAGEGANVSLVFPPPDN